MYAVALLSAVIPYERIGVKPDATFTRKEKVVGGDNSVAPIMLMDVTPMGEFDKSYNLKPPPYSRVVGDVLIVTGKGAIN